MMLFICFSNLHTNSTKSQRYKSLINAKEKRNKYQEGSANEHFLFARGSYREEFVPKFAEECIFFSCDNMNNIIISPSPAVSRYHQKHQFFM